LGISASEDIQNLLNGEQFFSDAFHFRKLRELIKGMVDCGCSLFEKILIENLGDLTFEEASKNQV
jgi:NTE family protein